MPSFFKNQPSANENAEFVTEAIGKLVASGAAEKVPRQPYVVNPLGVKFRRGLEHKPRLILDMRYVNSFLQKKKFKYETAASLPELLLRADFVWSVDITSAYHHVELVPAETTYFGFEWQGTFYEFKSLPFGLSVACWAFTKIMREMVGSWLTFPLRVPHADRPGNTGGRARNSVDAPRAWSAMLDRACVASAVFRA